MTFMHGDFGMPRYDILYKIIVTLCKAGLQEEDQEDE